MVYEHPVYTPSVLAAQQRLPELNNGVMAFAGA
jgi:predicted NAD/FAD-binding protein